MDTTRQALEKAQEEKCAVCRNPVATETVLIRRTNGGQWEETGIKRCVECKHTTGGTTEEVLAYVRNTYDYKYFGDYELTDYQRDAVWKALSIADQLYAERAALTSLFRTTPAVALRSGGYDELFKWLMEGGEAVGTAHFAYPVPVGRLRKGVLLEAVDQYQCVHISGLPFEAKQQAAFISECTRLGLKYILIQPEQK